MPNIKSAKKELRKTAKRTVRNSKVSDNMKKNVKLTKKAMESKDAKSADLIKKAFKSIDKAAKKGVIKKNTANRKKSRLQKKLNTQNAK